MRHLYPILLFLLPLISVGQNLVPNGSFEEYTECPDNGGQIERAIGWNSLISESWYFHECGTNGFGVPNNRMGFQHARSGQAYALVPFWHNTEYPFRRYIEIELSEPLVTGIQYEVKYFISFVDSSWYAVKNNGVHLSSTPHSEDLFAMLNLVPQVSYNDTVFLDDKIGWTEISGKFTASGGEKFLALGSFDDNEETDTLFIPDGGSHPTNPDYWDESLYFVDDVSITIDSAFLNVFKNNFHFSIYPNPANDNLRIESQIPLAHVKLRDHTGRVAMQETLRSAQRNKVFDVSSLPNGIYLLEAITEDGRRSVQKVVVE